MTKLPFEIKQKLATFKRLQRRFKIEKTTKYLAELAKLDSFLTTSIPGWKPTYSKHI